jgi:hypothetical protein
LLSSEATAHKDLGHYAEALQRIALAQSKCDALYGVRHWRCIAAREAEGWILSDTEQMNRAHQLLEAALAEKLEAFGPDSVMIGNSYYNLGNLAVRRLQYAVAEQTTGEQSPSTGRMSGLTTPTLRGRC